MEELRTTRGTLRREVVAPPAPLGARCGVAMWIAIALLAGAAIQTQLAPGPPAASHPGGVR
jgi:hypothetical protein